MEQYVEYRKQKEAKKEQDKMRKSKKLKNMIEELHELEYKYIFAIGREDKAKYKKLWKIKQDLIVIEAESEGVNYVREVLRENTMPEGPWA